MKGLFTLGLLFVAWQLTVRERNRRARKRLDDKLESINFKLETITKQISEYEKNKIGSNEQGRTINPQGNC